MRVIEHDPTLWPSRAETRRRPALPKVKTPLRTVPLDEHRELRLAIVTSDRGQSVMMRVYVRDNEGEMGPVTAPFYVFASQIAATVAALTEAAEVIGALPAAAPFHRIEVGDHPVPAFVTGHKHGNTDPENSNA